MSGKPKKKCCLSKPRCTRCPLRMLADGTLPDGYTVKRRRLVKVGKDHARDAAVATAGHDHGKAAKAAKSATSGKAATSGNARRSGKSAKSANARKSGKAATSGKARKSDKARKSVEAR